MVQANDVPTQLCAQITGAHETASTNPSCCIWVRPFAVLAGHAPQIDVRIHIYNDTFCQADLLDIAGSPS